MSQKRFFLTESEIPTRWYNITADMQNKPQQMLSPSTGKPVTEDELAELFSRECSRQELNTTDRWIEIPDEVREKYTYYRSTPLVRAYGLEEGLGLLPIYISSALAQAYYCKKEGVTNITTETGAGQWGTALAYASKVFDALVTPSPSMSTRAGKDILTKSPNYQGSLGTAISEAVELARMTPGCKYALGSVMSHVTLHQTVIGLEAEKQMEMAGEYPDIVIACFGGGSNFGGLCFPFLRHNLSGKRQTRFIAAEPAA